MSIAVKICGIRDEEALEAAVHAGASYIGFIHYPPSPRHVSFEQAAKLRARVPSHVMSVSVTVNADDDVMAEIVNHVRPNHIQLHGHETLEQICAIRAMHPGISLIKALPIRSAYDIYAIEPYIIPSDMLLFDAPPPPNAILPGGNGVSFDWSLLKDESIQRLSNQRPWFLSGGLTPENVGQALQSTGAKMLDVSSGVEASAGVKDIHKIRAFMAAVEQY